MPYLGTIVNVAAILLGGFIGLVLKRGLPKRITDTVLQGVALAVTFVGITGAVKAALSIVDGGLSVNHLVIMIVSLALGAVIGELIKIEGKLESFGKFCERKATPPVSHRDGSPGSVPNRRGGVLPPVEASTFAQGFVTATLVFCVGSMAIVGSLEDGINRNSDILLTKSLIDGISAMIFASTMGIGVLFSAVPVAVYQGLITSLAIIIAPYLSDVIVAQMSLVGSVLITAIGLNMLKIAKIKVGNMLPAIFIPVIYYIVRFFTG